MDGEHEDPAGVALMNFTGSMMPQRSRRLKGSETTQMPGRAR
jgi:hypothetical protein